MSGARSATKAPEPSAPLGVFDSGIGGLTVVHALRELLPGENIVYLGDTARVPYGTKGAATVVKYASACAAHLVGRGVKAIVIACNTVSAVAPEQLRIDLDLPVLGVIEPGARAAVAATRTGRIGVLATAGDLVFMGEGNGRFNAYDAGNGQTLWSDQLDAGVNAPPVTWQIDGVQYVGVAAGGNQIFGYKAGDTFQVYRLGQ